MRAVQFDGQLSVTNIPPPVPRDGDALIRMRMAGVCSTDLEITRGYMGFTGVLGHEFVGEVVEHPDSKWVGARVAGEINVACDDCDWCARDLGRHCPRRKVLGILGKDGAFAEYLTLPAQNLHRIPDAVEDRHAVFVEPLAAALEILEQVTIGPEQSVLIVGDGKLALLVAQVLATTGCTLKIVGKHQEKLAILDGLPLTAVTLRDLRTERHHVVIEASGSPTGFGLALESIRPRGTLVLKSTYAGEVDLDSSRLVIDEITVVGSRCGRFEVALDFMKRHALRLEPLVHATYPLRESLAAFERASSSGVLKVLLENDEET